MMSVHGTDIMHHVCEIMNELTTHEVTEQALCVLVNIANSREGKCALMRDEALIKRLVQFMVQLSVSVLT